MHENVPCRRGGSSVLLGGAGLEMALSCRNCDGIFDSHFFSQCENSLHLSRSGVRGAQVGCVYTDIRIGNYRNFLRGVDRFTDSMEIKPITTRKLRRRPNDPVPLPEKRRKPSPDILSFDSTMGPVQDVMLNLASTQYSNTSKYTVQPVQYELHIKRSINISGSFSRVNFWPIIQ